MSLTTWHRYKDSVRWRLTDKGVEVRGSGLERTPGEPITITRIWEEHGDDINRASQEFGVPAVLILATTATESGGRTRAVREEPRYVSDEETPHQVSSGMMQTLISTAREALNDPSITRQWLFTPLNSLRAGTAYIGQQKGVTDHDPPQVAAAYNAGGVYHRPQDTVRANRWQMRQYPLGTGEHVDRFIRWFNDAVAVLESHSKRPVVPYEVLLGEKAPPVAPPPKRVSAKVIIKPGVRLESDEAKAIVQTLRDAALDGAIPTTRITSSYRSNSGTFHGRAGTNGRGTAVDAAGPEPGLDTEEMAAIFHALAKPKLPDGRYTANELIYAGPVDWNINAHKRTGKYAEKRHHNHCFDQETEVLTPKGWIKGTALQPGDTIMGSDVEGYLRWQPVLHKVLRKHNGPMIRVTGQSVDFCVTPDHDLLVRTPQRQDAIRASGKTYTKTEAALAFGKQRYLPCAGYDLSPEMIDIPDAVIQLTAWLMTDGHISPLGHGWWISQSDVPDGRIELLENTLHAAGVDFRKSLVYDAGNGRRYQAFRYHLHRGARSAKIKPDWPKQVLSLVDTSKTFLPAAWMLSQRQLRLFLDAWCRGDGAQVSTKSRQSSSIRRDHMDFLQAAAARTGHRSRLYKYISAGGYKKGPTTVWRMSIGDLSETNIAAKNWHTEHYDGSVWCVTVPDGALLVRRYGRPGVAGNCHVAVEKGIFMEWPGGGRLEFSDEEDQMYFAQAFRDGERVSNAIWLVWGWHKVHVNNPTEWQLFKELPNIQHPDKVAQLSPEALAQLVEVPSWLKKGKK